MSGLLSWRSLLFCDWNRLEIHIHVRLSNSISISPPARVSFGTRQSVPKQTAEKQWSPGCQLHAPTQRQKHKENGGSTENPAVWAFSDSGRVHRGPSTTTNGPKLQEKSHANADPRDASKSSLTFRPLRHIAAQIDPASCLPFNRKRVHCLSSSLPSSQRFLPAKSFACN